MRYGLIYERLNDRNAGQSPVAETVHLDRSDGVQLEPLRDQPYYALLYVQVDSHCRRATLKRHPYPHRGGRGGVVRGKLNVLFLSKLFTNLSSLISYLYNNSQKIQSIYLVVL